MAVRFALPRLNLREDQRPPALLAPVIPIRPGRSVIPRSETARARHQAISRPSTSGTARLRFNPLCVTQNICPESQNLSIAFSGLTAITRLFFTENSLQTLSPGLPVFYAELSLALDGFCRHCTLVFSNHGRRLATGTVRPGNMLYDLGRKLALMWMDFISKINDLARGDVEPYRSQINQQFGTFFGCIEQLNRAIARTQFPSHHLDGKIERLTDRAVRCEEMIRETFDLAQSADFSNGETDVAEREVTGLLRQSKKLFERAIPSDAVPARERFRMRMTLVNTCAVILEILAAVGRFHRQIGEIRARIGEVNGEMTKLNATVHLPFKLTLSAAGESQELQEELDPPGVAPVQESLDQPEVEAVQGQLDQPEVEAVQGQADRRSGEPQEEFGSPPNEIHEEPRPDSSEPRAEPVEVEVGADPAEGEAPPSPKNLDSVQEERGEPQQNLDGPGES
jgi:hypothetical protein